eukprot:3019055-Pyramimonas_sp.AAC.1
MSFAMGRAINSATHHPLEGTYRGDAQLRTGVRDNIRGYLKRSGTLGEKGGKIMSTATASRGARGCGVDWDGVDKSRVSGGGAARSGEEEPGG